MFDVFIHLANDLSMCHFHVLQICKQVRILLLDLCQQYNVPVPEELKTIDSYLANKVANNLFFNMYTVDKNSTP